MIRLTKIFHFEMAHALAGYNGACRHIHGHSYELHVTVTTTTGNDEYISPPGFLLDFKALKQLVMQFVIEQFDHKLVLSGRYLDKHPAVVTQENLVAWEMEPSVENLLIYSKKAICKMLPPDVNLVALKLYETKDSYAEWVAIPC